MTNTPTDDTMPPFVAFDGPRLLATGALDAVLKTTWEHVWDHPASRPLLFHGPSSQLLDLQWDAPLDVVLARGRHHYAPLAQAEEPAMAAPARPAGRGRPRMGVVAREVTLLPRHWEWLSAQPGGASVTLRRLVDQARKAGAAAEAARIAREAGYRFMSAMAGDLPGFEEASRALFAGDARQFARHVEAWPPDIGDHLRRLARPGLAQQPHVPPSEAHPAT